ncbi:hypothetical protein P6U16_25495 (plasmid) [Rhizobium sp. 32-5/1]|uniref:hypothetical protein n=1 Tax=Rhizobium sp. 32-5/1 TaxID=3019602 RepID=UPI00240E7583|nr:hypothetical protein [Rhizobium sp. 32-5/1]WEZ85446.1 hypothetical protein P6U16_25495 [Rhizobium sp. 32-5/1]
MNLRRPAQVKARKELDLTPPIREAHEFFASVGPKSFTVTVAGKSTRAQTPRRDIQLFGQYEALGPEAISFWKAQLQPL